MLAHLQYPIRLLLHFSRHCAVQNIHREVDRVFHFERQAVLQRELAVLFSSEVIKQPPQQQQSLQGKHQVERHVVHRLDVLALIKVLVLVEGIGLKDLAPPDDELGEVERGVLIEVHVLVEEIEGEPIGGYDFVAELES